LRNDATDKQALPPVKEQAPQRSHPRVPRSHHAHAEAVEKVNKLDDLIEKYFVEASLLAYYEDAGLLATAPKPAGGVAEESRRGIRRSCRRAGHQIAEQLKKVRAAMKAAKRTDSSAGSRTKTKYFSRSKLIARYGCFACHEIKGFDNAKSIGTELSEWGSKPISKLDFGLLEMEHTRIDFLKQKLHAPRSYDTGRIGLTRSPQELLKMPKFNLTEDQIDQIVTFVSGMTDEKLTAQEPRQLTPTEFSIERGRWM